MVDDQRGGHFNFLTFSHILVRSCSPEKNHTNKKLRVKDQDEQNLTVRTGPQK